MKEDRLKIWEEYKGAKNPYIQRAFLEYNRYFEADLIIKTLEEQGVDISKLTVLDYGCGIGDYGFALGRKGATVCFYDFATELEFVRHRYACEAFEVERFEATFVNADVYKANHMNHMIIFGEVLEHLEDPKAELQKFIDLGAQYIFTSSFPCRPDDGYFRKAGHDSEGFKTQIPCRELLEKYFTDVRVDGEARVWSRR